jgi:hypothetical protein
MVRVLAPPDDDPPDPEQPAKVRDASAAPTRTAMVLDFFMGKLLRFAVCLPSPDVLVKRLTDDQKVRPKFFSELRQVPCGDCR